MRKIPEYLLVLYALSGTLSIAVSQIAMALGALATAIHRKRRGPMEWRRFGLERPMLAWTAALLTATVFASDPVASAVKMKKVILLATVFWPPLVILKRWNLGRVYMGLIFSAGVTSLYGALTFFLQGGPELGIRIRGFHGFYLTNSRLLLLCTFPALLFATTRSITASHRWGAGIAAAAMLVSQFFGCLHSAWLGTLVGLGYLAIRRRLWVGAWVLLGTAVCLFFVPDVLQGTARDLLDPQSPTNRERTQIWENGWKLFLDDPWSGWGLQDLSPEYERVKADDQPTKGHMHSLPVQVAATMGLPGLLAFGWLMVACFRALRNARRNTAPEEFPRAVVDGAEAALVAFLAAGIVDWNLGDSEVLALLFFLIGTAIAAGRLPVKAGP